VPRPTHRSEFEPYPVDAHAPLAPSNGALNGEAACIARAAAGDAGAWSDLVDRLQPSIWAATGALGLPPTPASQVCELVWLRLAQRLDNPPVPLRPWLVGMVEAEASRWHQRPPTSSGDLNILLDDALCQPIITSD
jgi:hypothetical protein